MTPVSANKCLEVINNTEYTLAIELWCSVVALRLRQKKQEGKPSSLAKRIETIVSKIVPEFSEDRVLYDEIEELRRAINKL
jgi:Histidine ammonia-lyase